MDTRARVPGRHGQSFPAFLAAAGLWLLAATAQAALSFSIALDDIVAPDWSAQGLSLSLAETEAGRYRVEIDVGSLVLPDDQGSVEGMHLDCEIERTGAGAWRCDDGSLKVGASPVGAQQGSWQGAFQSADAWQISIPTLDIARGQLALKVEGNGDAWTLRATPRRTTLTGLARLAGVDLPRDWAIKGRASGSVRLTGRRGAGSAGIARVGAELVVDQVSYASPDGTQAAENVVLRGSLSARRRGDGWSFDSQLRWPKGAVYSDPLYLDAAKSTLLAKSSGQWRHAAERLRLDSWSLQLDETLGLSGIAAFEGPAFDLAELTVAAHSDDAGQLYRRLLQPFLIGTVADDLDVSGRVGFVLHLDRAGVEQAGLELTRLALEDRRGRFSLDHTSGTVAWDRAATVPDSTLTIDGAGVYRIPTGAFSIRVRFAGDRVELREPVVVPLLGGAVALDSFAMDGALVAGDRPGWEASASVRGVSLQQLTAALEWPTFNGHVTGELRDMRYRDGVFRVGGGLQLDAFGGRIRVENLALRDPFGSVPILDGDATMRGLSLEALTETFSFGRIEGRLDAEVRDLQLVAWRPDRFDLHLYTPANDDSRHRISQRAVENLTALGNNGAVALSGTFLRFFESFSYDRLMLRVDLQGQRARLDGLPHAGGGYYLVKGAGLPRIDVIGRNREVAWRDLVERLRRIQLKGAKVR